MILFFVYTFIQVLHNLSMWSATDKVMTYDQVKADANKAKKDMKMVFSHTHTEALWWMYQQLHCKYCVVLKACLFVCLFVGTI